MNIEELQSHVIPVYNRFPILLKRGEGSKLYDENDKEYIDFVAGIAVNSLGYGDPGLKQAITNQLDNFTHVSNLYWTDEQKKATEILSEATGLDLAFLTNSGSEAVECAMKLARRYQALNKGEEANEIISMSNSFHGRTYGAITATAKPAYHEHFGPMLPGIVYAEFNNIDDLKDKITENTAAVILEPLQGEGGINPADKDYLKEVRELCDETGTLLIFDEVQCGAGRTGNFLASQGYGVKPDIVAVAKGIGSGFPVGACIATKEVGEYLAPGSHGSTYGGNPLACSVVSYVVDKINQPEFLESVKDKGEYLRSLLEELKEKYPEAVVDVRGEGLIQGIELSIPVSDVINQAIENGLLLVSASNNTIRLVPPLIITKEELKEGVGILDKAIATVLNETH